MVTLDCEGEPLTWFCFDELNYVCDALLITSSYFLRITQVQCGDRIRYVLWIIRHWINTKLSLLWPLHRLDSVTSRIALGRSASCTCRSCCRSLPFPWCFPFLTRARRRHRIGDTNCKHMNDIRSPSIPNNKMFWLIEAEKTNVQMQCLAIVQVTSCFFTNHDPYCGLVEKI